MAEQLNQQVADVKFDNLVNSAHEQDSFLVTIASGQGKLQKNTALAINDAGKYVILGTSGATANAILQKDVDATSADVVAPAYREGHFNANELIVKASYTLSAEDKENFRKVGILLSESL